LLKQQSVLRNSKTRGTAREEVAADVESGFGAGVPRCADTVTSKWSKGAEALQQGAQAGGNCIVTSGAVLQQVAVPYTKVKRAQSDTDDETWVEGQVNLTLSLFDCGDVRATTIAIQGNLIGRDKGGPQGVGASTEGAMYTMTKADVHGVAVAFHPTQDPISSTDGSVHAMGCGSSGGCATQAVAFPIDTQNMTEGHASGGLGFGQHGDPSFTVTKGHSHAVAQAVDTLQQQGYDANHASTQETNAVETLRVLRKEIGEEAFTAWGLGILDSFQPSQILRARLHGEGIRCATFSRSWAVYCAISREKNRAAGALQSVQEAEGKGCSPSGRELPQQFAEQLGTYLSQLSCPGPQAERFMHHLWCASEGIGFMRQALSAFQEERRPVHVEGQTPTAMTVRRLTPTECEFLQGFPRNYTLIPWRKKAAGDCPDGPRYKALGNSMAVNCMEWIGERIAAVEAEKETT
jgi:site-specific DNA-cytosine methylase